MSKIDQLEELYVRKNIGRGDTSHINPLAFIQALGDLEEVNNDGVDALQLATRYLDTEALTYLLDKGVEPSKDASDNTLLHILAQSPLLARPDGIVKHEQQVEQITALLLKAGVKPKRKNNYDKIAYVIATESLIYPMLKVLAADGLKMNASKDNGMNLLHFILEQASYNKPNEIKGKCIEETVKGLLSGGINPSDKDSLDKDAEHYARKADLRGVVAILLGNDSVKEDGAMQLVEALTKKEFSIADKLLENGADINVIDEKSSMTPLMWFCQYPDLDAVRYLVDHQADLHYVDGNSNQTAMSFLITSGYKNRRNSTLLDLQNTFKILLKGGYKVDSFVDGRGNTALNLLCAQPNMEGINTKFVELLIDKGANVDLPNHEGCTPLMSFAAYNADESTNGIVELLLDEEADVTKQDRYGNTALAYMVAAPKDMEAKIMANLVLEVDTSSIQVANNQGDTPLAIALAKGNDACTNLLLTYINQDKMDLDMLFLKACQTGNKGVIQAFLKKGSINVDKRDANGNTPLYYVASKGFKDVVQTLISEQADVMLANNLYETPLHKAAEYGSKEIIEMLIQAGADVNATNNKAQSPLIYAIKNRKSECVSFLLKHGAETVNKDNEGFNALDYASAFGLREVVENLVQEDGSQVDDNGNTPLHQAVYNNLSEVVNKLLKHKDTNINALNDEGYSPLVLAVINSNTTITEELINAGADTNLALLNGNRALHYAAIYGHTYIAKLLLDAKADVNSCNEWSETPLLVAALKGRNEMTALLIARGANVNAVDNKQKSALFYATEGSFTEIVEQLIMAGAEM